jgi:hypothetical protein
MIINDLFNNKKTAVAEGMTGKVVFSGTGADGSTYEIIQSSPIDFMIHANGRHIDTYGSLQRAMSVLKNEVPGLQQGVAEGGIATVGWPDEGNHTGNNPPVSVGGTFDARPVVKIGSLVKASGLSGVYRVMDIIRDEAKIVQEIPRTGQSTYVPMSDLRVWTNKPIVREQGAAESIADDMAAMAKKKFPNAYISKNGQEVQKPENWGKRYTPPAAAPADLEKQQRDLTAKYPNIDELVRRAELNRDPDYEMADGQAYYAARDAEQNYQKLRQIQRVIQGLNESLNRSHLP